MNLRKDHCRDPTSQTREHVNSSRAGAWAAPPTRSGFIARTLAPSRPAAAGRREDRTRRPRRAPRNLERGGAPSAPPPRSQGAGVAGYRLRRWQSLRAFTVRLSATDISALASTKNVAKCDTWCELQNPANHRVFERKLRPRPSGRGHACLGANPSGAPLPRVPYGPRGLPDADDGTPRRARAACRRVGRRLGPDAAGGGRARDPVAVPPDPGP